MTDDVECLRKEISKLRSKLLFYEQHHRHCAIGRQHSPPPDEECINSPYTVSDTTHTTVDNLNDPHNGFKIITFEPHSLKPKAKTKSPQRDPQWRTIADQLVAKVPDATQWGATKEGVGLRSTKDNITVISTIAGTRLSCGLFDTNHAGTISDGYSQKASHDLIALATSYAWMTKASQVKASFACLLNSFQELIFASLCVVLERNGTDVALIDDAMRICISDTEPRNLKRLRHGAAWANRMIVDLAKSTDGWDCYRATEMVLLCGVSISKYGILAGSAESLEHLSSLLKTSKYTKAGSDILCAGPFSIPAFIKVLVGDQLELKDICIALNYQESCLEHFSQLSSWYQTVLRDLEAGSVEGGTFTKKRKLNGSQLLTGREVECSRAGPHNYPACLRRDSQQASIILDTNYVQLDPQIHRDRTENYEHDDFVQSDPLQQLRGMVNTSENTLASQQLTESRTDTNEMLNAGNNLSPFDYNNAYDLTTIAFDYNAAYDLTTIAFDYNSAYDLTSIAFNDTSYNLPSFANPHALPEEGPSRHEPNDAL